MKNELRALWKEYETFHNQNPSWNLTVEDFLEWLLKTEW